METFAGNANGLDASEKRGTVLKAITMTALNVGGVSSHRGSACPRKKTTELN